MSAPNVQVLHGDCLDILAQLPDNSVDAVITDPPYGLANTDPQHVADTIVRWVNGDRDYIPTGKGFMGKAWDAFVPPVAVWDECYRVLKPGGHLLTFAGSRTMDLMTLGVRLAGFDIRDSIAWLYGSGFPKSLDVSKAIDKAAGATREVVGIRGGGFGAGSVTSRAAQSAMGYRPTGDAYPSDAGSSVPITAPATPEAQRWQGWGTALKPAFEPIVVARKPLQGTVAANVQAWGTGALNIDATRVQGAPPKVTGRGWDGAPGYRGERVATVDAKEWAQPAGRWPANVVLDGSQADLLDSGSAPTKSRIGKPRGAANGDGWGMTATGAEYDDQGGPSRFFPTFRYQAKAPTSERPTYEREGDDTGGHHTSAEKRCTHCGKQRVNVPGAFCVCPDPDFQPDPSKAGKVAHPTVKPLDLMRWLVRLVTPPGGTVLEPFAGSGTTIEAAMLEGFDVIGIEREADYLPLIQQRIDRARAQLAAAATLPTPMPTLFDEEATAPQKPQGRWPANVVLDRSQAAALDQESGQLRARGNVSPTSGGGGMYGHGVTTVDHGSGDTGGASRFFPVFDSESEASA